MTPTPLDIPEFPCAIGPHPVCMNPTGTSPKNFSILCHTKTILMSLYWKSVNDVTRLILYSVREWEGVELPLPQKSGTWTQKYAYAEMRAKQIVKTWLKEQS